MANLQMLANVKTNSEKPAEMFVLSMSIFEGLNSNEKIFHDFSKRLTSSKHVDALCDF